MTATAIKHIGNYCGEVTTHFNNPQVLAQLADLPRLLTLNNVTRLSNGADYVVKLPLELADGNQIIAVKVFKRQSALKDWYDRRHKSKAERSFCAAVHLQSNGIGTPAPIAWLDRWQGNRLIESYYVCCYESAICFRDALSDIYYNLRDNAPLMALLTVVAPAIRAMHDAGFMHGDLGNQNILLPRDQNNQWLQPQVIDLNRGIIQTQPLDEDQRARDLSRIQLPGAYLKIFKFIYSKNEDIPTQLNQLEQSYRHRFEWHTRSRKYRHPLRHWKKSRRQASRPVYPPLPDIWLWDEKSAQPMTVLERREKKQYRNLGYALNTVWQSLCALPKIFKLYKHLMRDSFKRPLSMSGRIGVALHPHTDYIEQELALLNELGNPPVLIRFCHHETTADWGKGIALINQLHAQGIEVMAAFLQDRQAVLQPESWAEFLNTVIGTIADKVAHIEITHAFNRVKWGIWSAHEHAVLMQPAFALQQRFPHIKLTGPACIDFEYHPTIAALKAIPAGNKLSALSHLLYVDRRGSPESKQGNFSTLEKCALLKALAVWSDRCENSVIVSEVNWPIKYTGIWSPIGCPYEAPKWRREEPGETEDVYADYMLRYLVLAICSGHVEQVFWWRLSAHGYGLVDDLDQFKPRPAFLALSFFLKLIGTGDFVRKLPTPTGIYSFEFYAQHQSIIMAWCDGLVTENLPTYEYCEAYDRNGSPLLDVKLSGSPVYLINHNKP